MFYYAADSYPVDNFDHEEMDLFFEYEETDAFFDDDLNEDFFDEAFFEEISPELADYHYDQSNGSIYWVPEEIEAPPSRLAPSMRSVDGLSIGAMALIVFIFVGLLWDRQDAKAATITAVSTAVPLSTPLPTLAPTPSLPTGPDAIIAPYDNYILTQGVHGQSYGHLAIDLKAGQGAIIKAPISGVVTALYLDEIGNPTLVIENEVYRVIMLHGEYKVGRGDEVEIGEPVGIESNLGNTRDAWGNSCRGRDCGYHTHLNVFDKRIGANVNPLHLLNISR